MNNFSVPEKLLNEITAQASREYPHECCGMILGPADAPDSLTRLRPCRNAQDQFHNMDPVRFPRTARTAYFIDPNEHLAIEKELRTQNEAIRVIYHSHTDFDAYFSEEDHRMALAEGEPIYPGVGYLVTSVRKGKVDHHKLFFWNPEKGRYTA